MEGEKLLSEKQGYAAMVFFVEKIHERFHSDDLGELLGSMSWMGDEEPVDAAYTAKWKDAIQKALNGEKPFLKRS